ncbi:MAG: response regulator [bacterium]|nr:response regulator [bacterium]
MNREDSTELEIEGVVHDVNQMLMAIIGRSEYLQRFEAPEGMVADLASIETAARDAAAMLRRLVPAGRDDSDDFMAELRICAATVIGVIRPPGGASWSPAGTESGPGVWSFVNDVPAGLVADLPPVLVREVLNNLLLNALEVLPDGGCITVEAAGAGDRVQLWLSDDGPGVADDLAPRIFEAGQTTSGETGRGVGLAACRRILAARNAVLDLAAPRHGGATFVLDLPAAAAAGPQAPEASVTGVRVLVVDDEPAVRDMLTDVLREWSCRVTAVADGTAARESMAAGAFDAALVDLSLPDGAGDELAASLRERDPATGIVLMTGVDRAGALAGTGDGAVDATVLKPLDLDGLQRLLTAMADLARARRQDGPDRKDTS